MSIVEALKGAGYKQEVSTIGDKPILEGVYKSMFVDFKNEPDGKFGSQLMAEFKITERLAGSESRSTFSEFRDYYKTDGEGAGSKSSGIAKLLNGFFSVGVKVDTTSDDSLIESLTNLKGTAEVFIKAYKKQKMKKVGDEYIEVEGEYKQGFTFMTEKNALKEAEKQIKKAGHPL